MTTTKLKEMISKNALDEKFAALYGQEKVAYQRERYLAAVRAFEKDYGVRDASLFSVSGRSEISGNHTDHNRGKVIAGSIDLDIIAIASRSGDEFINLHSEGFRPNRVSLDDLIPAPERKFSSNALIAGMCDGFVKNEYRIGGFDAYTTSSVLKGSGLSSSAAFEVMVGNILNHLYNDGKVSNVEIAKISQYSENVFFGKASGLMDQMACAVGGFIYIDFESTKDPVIEKLDFDLNKYGYTLFIVNTGGNHADLNEDYSSVPKEMKKIASLLGKEVLRECSYEEVIKNASTLREKAGDRAVLRAIHFFNENRRVEEMRAALGRDDLDAFLSLVIESGNSSFRYLQNVYTTKNVEEQGLSLALALSENLLKGKRAAWRVHGGGFAGTIQAFVPHDAAAEYKTEIEKVFGEGSCIPLHVRKEGAVKLA